MGVESATFRISGGRRRRYFRGCFQDPFAFGGKIEEWGRVFPEALFLYNDKKHSSARISPYKVVFGRRSCTWVGEKLHPLGQDATSDASDEPAQSVDSAGDLAERTRAARLLIVESVGGSRAKGRSAQKKRLRSKY